MRCPAHHHVLTAVTSGHATVRKATTRSWSPNSAASDAESERRHGNDEQAAAGRATRFSSAHGPPGRAANQGQTASRANDAVATTVWATEDPVREGRGSAATARVATPTGGEQGPARAASGHQCPRRDEVGEAGQHQPGRHDPAVWGSGCRERADRLGAGVEAARLCRRGPRPPADQGEHRQRRTEHCRARPPGGLAPRLARGLGHAHHPRSGSWAAGRDRGAVG